ncbi:hypothetical protein TH66_04995 [Carbonactinospora thermoautotrophica]|uniref:Uncharacterized protein n=1 Tax=Carbonactinospora thermoautotrophica TaxID=1469144 RepID=A0A132N4Z0_9ACTN|nr:hypothetical protein TH66_04995 [Carbonactinospora thermoautotrophica]KWX06584.1 hypothetical protein TR74_21580 [Carbonactinospora thermoautotrophica]
MDHKAATVPITYIFPGGLWIMPLERGLQQPGALDADEIGPEGLGRRDVRRLVDRHPVRAILVRDPEQVQPAKTSIMLGSLLMKTTRSRRQ